MCDTTTGECTCKDYSPFGGPRCDQPCGTNCDKGCTQLLMTCRGCKDKTKAGDKCDEPCPANCVSCYQKSYMCYSCKEGFSGTLCECSQNCKECVDGKCNDCKDGFWGASCSERCNENCYLNGHTKQTCYQTGTCDFCSDGFWGLQCNSNCSTHCITTRCNKDRGECRCKVGYTRNTCHQVYHLLLNK